MCFNSVTGFFAMQMPLEALNTAQCIGIPDRHPQGSRGPNEPVLLRWDPATGGMGIFSPEQGQ